MRINQELLVLRIMEFGDIQSAGPYAALTIQDPNTRLMAVAGQLGVKEGLIVPGGIVPETHASMDRVGTILRHVGLGFDNVFSTHVTLAEPEDFAPMNAVYASYFTEGRYPARRTDIGLIMGRVEVSAIVEVPQDFQIPDLSIPPLS